MPWIPVEERLPEPGVEVPVLGAHSYSKNPATAKLRKPDDPRRRDWGPWDSREWRGTVGITHWWEDSPVINKQSRKGQGHAQRQEKVSVD